MERRIKYNVYTGLARHLLIVFQVSRIFLEIFFGAKLHGVDEYTHNYDIRMLLRRLDKAHMSFMKIAHCGD